MSTIPQFAALQRRLNDLNLKKAQYGISADPSINTEAEDLDRVISQMKLIDIHRARLDHLLKQRADFGLHIPTYINTEIAKDRASIAQLIQVCARLGQSVPSHPVDSDEPEIEPPPIRSVPRQVPPPTDIREKLDQIERLLNEIRNVLP